MKNHLEKAEYADFLLILLFFIFPPIFVPFAAQKPPGLSYSPAILAFHVLFSFFLYAAVPLKRQDAHPPGTLRKAALSFFVLCALAGINAAFSFCAEFFGFAAQAINFSVQSGFDFLSLVGATLIFACYEELLYRRYFPERFKKCCEAFFPRLSVTVPAQLVFEIFPVLCFALAHRYLGFFAVLNALCAGIILRFCVKKTGSVWYACAVHFAYNTAVLLLQNHLM